MGEAGHYANPNSSSVKEAAAWLIGECVEEEVRWEL